MAETLRNFRVQMWFENGTHVNIEVSKIAGTKVYRALRIAKSNKKPITFKQASGNNYTSPPGLLRYTVKEL